MGLRSCVVVSATSFLLGILFTHWIADSLTLWRSPYNNEHLWTAAVYYSFLARSPSEMGYFLLGIVILGGVTILWSLRDGAAGNLMFDGGSIFLYTTAVAVYLNKILPGFSNTFFSLPDHPPSPSTPFPALIKAEVLNLASANLVCSVALTGVLGLQAGRWWAERTEPDDEDDDLTMQTDESRPQTRHTTPSRDR